MARNKYPEQTVQRILQAASTLFLEKGYENTSIQDIINSLDGLSKGAIYHHFKSKEDLVASVVELMEGDLFGEFEKIAKAPGLTGLEKLREILRHALKAPKQQQIAKAVPTILRNPKFLAMQIENGEEEFAPKVIEPLIRMGMEDGSISTQFPKELAQVLVLMFNLWLNPFVFASTDEEIRQKCRFFQHLAERLNTPVLDDQMVELICRLHALCPKANKNQSL